MKIKRKIAMLLFLTLIITSVFTACAPQNADYIMEIDGKKVPVGVFLSTQQQAYGKIAEELSSGSEEATITKDMVLNAQHEGMSGDVYINDFAISELKMMYATTQKFQEYGLELTKEDLAYISDVVEQNMSYLGESYRNAGVGDASMNFMVEISQKGTKIFDYYYSEEGEAPVGQSDIFDELAADFAKTQTYYITLSDKATDEEIQNVKDTFNGFVTQIEDQDKILSRLINEFNAREQGDTTTYNMDSLTEYVPFQSSEFPQDYVDALFAAPYDKPFVFESGKTIFISIRKDIKQDQEAYEQYRPSIVRQLKGEEFDELLTKWGSEVDQNELNLNQVALDFYTPSKMRV